MWLSRLIVSDHYQFKLLGISSSCSYYIRMQNFYNSNNKDFDESTY